MAVHQNICDLLYFFINAFPPMMPREKAYLCVAAFYILMFIVFYAKRTSWIQQPLVRIIANILTSE